MMLTVSQRLHKHCCVVHGTAFMQGDQGVLLLGPSGSGKSFLAMKALSSGGHLVSDDQVTLSRQDNMCFLSPPDALRGMIEVFSLGLYNQLPYVAPVPLTQIFCYHPQPERWPPKETLDVMGLSIPLVRLDFLWHGTWDMIRFILAHPKHFHF